MLTALAPALTSPLLADGMGGPGGWHGGPGFPLLLLGPLFWLVVIVLVIVLVGRGRRRAHEWHRRESEQRRSEEKERRALEASAPLRRAEVTLAERFAQGDIDEAEYRKRLEVLRAGSAPMP